MYCYSVALPHSAVGWSAVCDKVFPDHTHLLFYVIYVIYFDKRSGNRNLVTNLHIYYPLSYE